MTVPAGNGIGSEEFSPGCWRVWSGFHGNSSLRRSIRDSGLMLSIHFSLLQCLGRTLGTRGHIHARHHSRAAVSATTVIQVFIRTSTTNNPNARQTAETKDSASWMQLVLPTSTS